MDFLLVAEGKFGGCINYLQIWDISMGLIITEAQNDESIWRYIIHLDENSPKEFCIMAGSENIINEFMCSF